MKVKSDSEVAQSCPTPSDPMDCSPPGSPVHRTLQARVLEWGAIALESPGIKIVNKAGIASVIIELSVEQKIRELCRKVLRNCIAQGTLLNTL